MPPFYYPEKTDKEIALDGWLSILFLTIIFGVFFFLLKEQMSLPGFILAFCIGLKGYLDKKREK